MFPNDRNIVRLSYLVAAILHCDEYRQAPVLFFRRQKLETQTSGTVFRDLGPRTSCPGKNSLMMQFSFRRWSVFQWKIKFPTTIPSVLIVDPIRYIAPTCVSDPTRYIAPTCISDPTRYIAPTCISDRALALHGPSKKRDTVSAWDDARAESLLREFMERSVISLLKDTLGFRNFTNPFVSPFVSAERATIPKSRYDLFVGLIFKMGMVAFGRSKFSQLAVQFYTNTINIDIFHYLYTSHTTRRTGKRQPGPGQFSCNPVMVLLLVVWSRCV